MDLDEATRARLLRCARRAIEAQLHGEDSAAEPEPWPDLPRCGVFVTLRRHGQLRGCIGIFTPQEDLPSTVRSMAQAAAHDPRFLDRPLSLSELPELRIEISLLSPLERRENPLDFQLGRHGIYIKRGHRVGCFLPEVATEHGWDQATFLTQCCGQKAGLDPLAWQEPETQVFVFTVEKLAEKADWPSYA